MGQEINFESISALEKEIDEGKGDIIKLKRTRNSMLNISVLVPPEILGYIFNLLVVSSRSYSAHPHIATPMNPRIGFGDLENGWYNFLLVCHHWFEVAYGIPELWTFWGNSLDDWEKRSIRAGSAPVDLVLYDDRYHHPKVYPPQILSVPLQNNLLGRTAQDTIREIHICIDSRNFELVAFIISLLTPNGEGARERSIESIILLTGVDEPMDFSNFFARSRLPKLQRLHLGGPINASVGIHLMSQTTCLTSLNLSISWEPPPLSISQLLSILLSNPNLRDLSLTNAVVSLDIDESEIRVPLRRLEVMILCGKSDFIFILLQRLELPAALNYTQLIFTVPPVVEDIPRTLGPYMQNRLLRDVRFQEKRSVNCYSSFISVRPFTEGTFEETECAPTFVIDIYNRDILLDLMELVLCEHVVLLKMDHSMGMRQELFIAMPNIEWLSLRDVSLTDGFLQPDQTGPHANAKLLPSLRYLDLEDVTADTGWRPLVDYLVHQTSNRQAISLTLGPRRDYDVPPEVIEEIEGLVEAVDIEIWDDGF